MKHSLFIFYLLFIVLYHILFEKKRLRQSQNIKPGINEKEQKVCKYHICSTTINWNKNTLKTVKLVFAQRTIDFWITSSNMCSGPLSPCFPLSFFISLKRCCLWKEHNYIMPSHIAFSFDLEALIFFCCYVIKHLSPKHILISTQTEYVLPGNEPTTISLLRS